MNHFYQEMQSSAEVWLGEVPSQWRSFRIKDVARLSPNFSKGTPEINELCSVIPMDKVSEKGEIISDNVEEYNLITSGLTNFEAGDVIFAKITPCMENGKGAYVKELPSRYAFGSTEFHVLRPRQMVDGKFIYYYTYNSVYRDYAEANMTGAAGQKRVSSRFINYTRIFLPDIAVQVRIAAYLDKTCAAIDKAIEAKQKQLEILDALRKSIIHKAVTRGLDDSVELKDSGVEWLGRIPRRWKVRRIKSVADTRYGLGQPPAQKNDGVPMVRATNVSAGKILAKDLIFVDPRELPPGRNPYLKEGEIIVVRSGAYTGDSAIIPKQYDGAVAGYDMVITVTQAEPRFLAYSLLSDYVLNSQILLLTLRAAQPHLNAHELGGVRLSLPETRTEQREICDYLDLKLSESARITETIVAQISTLEQYRKSLIH